MSKSRFAGIIEDVGEELHPPRKKKRVLKRGSEIYIFPPTNCTSDPQFAYHWTEEETNEQEQQVQVPVQEECQQATSISGEDPEEQQDLQTHGQLSGVSSQ